MTGVQDVLERKESELVQVLQRLEGLAVEKSAVSDEIQLAAERDLAIRSIDHESGLLRECKAHCTGFTGASLENLRNANRRRAAGPRTARCVQRRESTDRAPAERIRTWQRSFTQCGVTSGSMPDYRSRGERWMRQ
jgi:hypothetical protein